MTDFTNADISHNMIDQVVRCFSGYAGLGVVYSQAVSQWLLAFGNTNDNLHNLLASFGNLVAISLTTWAAYRAMRLDTMPGVRPIGIDGT
jgi:hypothetical protein